MEHENLQNLGFFGICKEAIKIIFTWRMIFLQITLTLILPLSIACLTHVGVSMLLFYNISHSKIIVLWLINMVIFALVIALFFASTAVVAYCVALIYSGKQQLVTFNEVIRVIPMARKRLMTTFLWGFGFILGYNCVLIFLFLVIFSTLYSSSDKESGLILGLVFYGLYLVGLFYMGVIWLLAIPVLVMEEENYGIHAMKKSKELLKGKMGIALAIVLAGTLWGGGAGSLFGRFVVFDQSTTILEKAGIGLISLILFVVLFLLGHVVQSVFYFVDKSYHHESIDYESIVHDHSTSNLGNYTPLDSTDARVGPIPA